MIAINKEHKIIIEFVRITGDLRTGLLRNSFFIKKKVLLIYIIGMVLLWQYYSIRQCATCVVQQFCVLYHYLH